MARSMAGKERERDLIRRLRRTKSDLLRGQTWPQLNGHKQGRIATWHRGRGARAVRRAEAKPAVAQEQRREHGRRHGRGRHHDGGLKRGERVARPMRAAGGPARSTASQQCPAWIAVACLTRLTGVGGWGATRECIIHGRGRATDEGQIKMCVHQGRPAMKGVSAM